VSMNDGSMLNSSGFVYPCSAVVSSRVDLLGGVGVCDCCLKQVIMY
jgi:hypothetical protein